MKFKLFCVFLALLMLSACTAPSAQQTQPPVSAQPSLPAAEEDWSEASPSQTVQPKNTAPSQEEPILKITFGEHTLTASFENNRSAEEFRELLSQGPLTIEMQDYGGFEKVGSLGTTLTRCDESITTKPGDVILYQGNQITLYYDTNTWNFTRLARIDDASGLKEKLGDGTVQVTFSLE